MFQTSNGNQSLFWQQVSSKKHVVNKVEKSECSESPSTSDSSVIIDGSWASEIHKENLERLNQMSQEEILKEKSKLEMTLKPELIQFLKNRKNKKQKINQEKLENTSIFVKDDNITSMNKERIISEVSEGSSKNENVTLMQVDEPEQSIPKPPIELMGQAKEKGWVHMDSLEPEKLKWMEDVPVDKKDEPPPNEPYNARFDFNGK